MIGNCGAYSHTKMSGISTYAMPQPIKAEECLRIVNEGIYSDSGVDINVKVDAITSYNLITHGTIKHTATPHQVLKARTFPECPVPPQRHKQQGNNKS